MGSQNSTPPPPPGLTAEEKNLLEKQGVSLDKFNEILNQGSLDAAETQNLLKNLSGLYRPITKPGTTTKGQTTYKNVINTQAIKDALARKGTGARGMNSTTVNGKVYSFDQLEQALNNPEIAKQMGLTSVVGDTTPDVNTPESTGYELDPVAVEALKQRLAAETKMNQNIGDLSAQRMERALKGDQPASTGLLQRKLQDFALLKEGAARKGIVIDGDTAETAVSQSTAGNELVGQFKRTYGLLEDTERRGDLNNPLPINSTVPGTVGMASQNPQMGLLPQYSQLATGYGNAMTPYTNQRMMGYQSSLYGYGQGRSSNAALSGLLGTGAGIAAGAGGPWGYGIAAGLGGLGLLSAL